MLPQQQQKLTRIGDGVLYSTLVIGTGTLASGSGNFFAYGQGANTSTAGAGAAIVSTITETNARIGGALPGGSAFSVHGLALHLFNPANTTSKVGPTRADFNNFIDGAVLSWVFTQARIEIAPVDLVGTGGGFFGIGAGATLVTEEINIGNGGYYRLKNKVILPPLAAFSIGIFWPASAVAMGIASTAKLTLVGTYQNAIEAG